MGSEPTHLGIPGLEDVVEIGRGGFATVFRAYQPAFRRTVAVKVISDVASDPVARERFQRECQAMGLLSEHPSIVTVLDAGFLDDGRAYLVMPYMPAGSLGARVRQAGPMRWEEASRVAVKLAGALHAAHDAGVIHRDVKPSNVLVSEYGEPKLADFGIARIAGGKETRAGSVTASLAFAPPEILEGGPASVRADLYSLAATTLHLLLGAPPFAVGDGTLAGVLARIASEPPPDVRAVGVPDPFARVLERAMAKDPAERHETVERFGRAVRLAQDELGVKPTELTILRVIDEPSEASPPRTPRPGPDDVTRAPAGLAPQDDEHTRDVPVPAPAAQPVGDADADADADERGQATGVAPTTGSSRRGLLAGALAAVVLVVVVVALVLDRDATEPALATGDDVPTAEAPAGLAGRDDDGELVADGTIDDEVWSPETIGAHEVVALDVACPDGLRRPDGWPQDGDLRDTDLSGATLTCIDLSGADLRGANLGGTVMDGVDLTGADLSDANATEAFSLWRHVVLDDVQLDGAALVVELDGVDLRGVPLGDAGLDLIIIRSIADGLDLSGATNHNGQEPANVLIVNSSARDARLAGSVVALNGADVTGADLTGASVTGLFVDASNAVLRDVQFGEEGVVAEGWDLTGATVEGAVLVADTRFATSTCPDGVASGQSLGTCGLATG